LRRLIAPAFLALALIGQAVMAAAGDRDALDALIRAYPDRLAA